MNVPMLNQIVITVSMKLGSLGHSPRPSVIKNSDPDTGDQLAR
jgi:hypothetical protein